jgi:hypothetical protein
MADLIYQLILAAVLLALLPQLAGWGVGAVGVRRGSWGPILLAIVAAPLVYWLLASRLYSPGGHSIVQFTEAEAGGPIEVENLLPGMLAHGIGALILQVFRLVRGH